MDARAIIVDIREGRTPSEAALRWFAGGLADGRVSDAQAGAFAMAVLLNGLDGAGRVALTLGMRDSGHVLDWALDAPVIDKHSTGGVGDCVSLPLAPALAACGAYVPMISGRGLGHTGGTLDKLEAIPGLRTDPDERTLRRIVQDAGCAIVSASRDIAPADKRLYAIRDVTGTVESLDLITASILSKKLAAGLDSLVLDVKCGSGAFMKTREEARALARALVDTANDAGCATSALITDMSQPLAPAMGNALEVAESMRVLCNNAAGPLRDLTVALGGELLRLSGVAESTEIGCAKIDESLSGGAAAERFGRMVAALGGPTRFVEEWARFLPEATVIREVPAPQAGVITAMDGEALGLAVVGLGGGRQVESDVVDPAVGLSDILPIGTRVEAGQPLMRLHASRVEGLEDFEARILAAITLGETAPDASPLVLERVGG